MVVTSWASTDTTPGRSWSAAAGSATGSAEAGPAPRIRSIKIAPSSVIGLMRPLSITREAVVVGTNIEDALGAWIDECVVGQFEPGTKGAIAEVAKPSMTTPIVRDLLPPPGQRAGEAP